ncbi:hypothetical protein FHR83_007034 [Actinoplanes campanulatus]|uniref:Homeodomain-like domain-containing protein n=1 Tax=Actinoplanes campanulatus TaxID=113559 RepID=A0A7W5AN78_9ACTN|nr:helix-turn-helix domain-containing protein [Actinoplanes campanulatus]MBB3099328.1 hypothetical protein [Actinoplanes campanulatus]
MTDLAETLTTARQLLAPDIPAGYVVVIVKAADCHPDRPVGARGLCRSCYETACRNGTERQHNPQRQHRPVAEFAEEYDSLADQGLTTKQIAERLGVGREAVYRARRRAISMGLLGPDGRIA